jgi:hypothetical protein
MEKQIRKKFDPARLKRIIIDTVVGSRLGIGGLSITIFED